MNHLLKSLLISIPFGIISTQAAAITKQGTQLTSNGCYQESSNEPTKNAVLNTLSKKVQFLNADNATFSLEQRMKELKVSAVSIAEIRDNKIAWSTAYGVTHAGSTSNVDCKTLFQAASIAKPVAMMGVLKMADNKVVDLDREIQAYLTSFNLPKGKQTNKHPVTFKNLLNHTSGITPGGYLGYAKGEKVPTDIDVAMGGEYVNSPAIEVLSLPNQQLRYSGGAYTLAQIALQDIFKKPFEYIMNEWVLAPTSMNLSTFSQHPISSTESSIAHGHLANGTKVKGGWHNHPELAAAGLWSNANDLAHFLIEIGKGFNGKSTAFSKSVVNELLTTRIDNHYYGFHALGEGTNLAIAHYGGNVGYRSAMLINIATGDGVVILVNSDNGSFLTGDILRALSQQNNWPHFKTLVMTQANVNEKQLKDFSGKYSFTEQGWQIDVVYNEDAKNIAIVFPNKDVYPLSATTKMGDHFIHPDTGVEVVFLRNNEQLEIKLYGQVGIKN